MKLIIQNVTILTLNANLDILENANVVIEDSIITRIFTKDEMDTEYDEVIDGTGKILTPGFINTHTHVPLALFRGLGDDMKDRLVKLLIPLENDVLNSKLAYISSKFSMAEMMKSGTTCFADMHMFTDEIAQAAKELGMRAFIGQHISDGKSNIFESSEQCIDMFLKGYHEYKDDSLIHYAIAPHSPYLCSKETLKRCHELAHELEVPILIHMAEMEHENKLFEEYGSVVKYLEEIGVLSERLIAAHGILVDEEDIQILANHKVSIAHCPSGNSKSGREIAPVYEYIKAGVNVSLATDGPMSGNHMDMTSVMNYTPKMQKVKYQDRNLCKAKEVVKMATINGAKALGIDHLVGSIEVGKIADLILINPNTLNMMPVYDYYSAIVYSMHPNNVDYVFIQGDVVVKDSKLVKISEESILKEFQNTYEYIKTRSKSLIEKVEKDE